MIERKYKVAFGTSAKAKQWINKELTWEEFTNHFTETKRTPDIVSEYFNMTKEQRGSIKDVGGFVCGYSKDGGRTKDSITSRSMVCLDLDNRPNIEDVWDKAKLFKCIMYSTHSHTPQEPRLRLVLPLNRDVTPEEYEKVAKTIARFISGIEVTDSNSLNEAIGKSSIFDSTTYQHNRLMYLPSSSKDGEYIYRNSGNRPEARVEVLLRRYSERIEKYENKEEKRGNTIQDPTTKNGYIGAFCKAYNIHEAIDKFLSDVYIPGSKENRYTYIKGGNSGNGLQVFDNGLLAYSHQDHDLISGKGEFNSFDLVRVHKYGHLDSEDDLNNLPSSKLPSFKKMCELVNNDEEAKKYLLEEDFNKSEIKKYILSKDFTNDGLLNDFNNTYGKDIKYVSDMERYIVWNGKVWVITDDKLIHKKIIEYVRNLIQQMEELFKEIDSDEVKWLKPTYSRLKNLTPIKVIRDNFKGICSWVKSSDLDNDDNLLNCGNGMLNLKTMELSPHNKEALCTKVLNIDYIPGAKCDNFFNSLEWIFDNPDTRKELQKAYGYSIMGETMHEVVFILKGKGLNGKSTITKPLIDIFGDYYGAIDYISLEPKKDKAAPSSDFAKLVNKRVVITSEPKNHFTIDDGVLKTISSGEPLCARFMRQNEFTFRPKFKLWIPTNILPYITNTDFGFWRRLIIFPCDNLPKKDIKGFYDKFIKPEELPGVLNWAIDGFKILQKEGFTPTDEMLKATEVFRQDVNPMERFIKEQCILDENEKIRTTELLCKYNEWVQDEGYSEMKVRNFRAKIIDLGFDIKKSTDNKSFVFGIAEVKENIENDFI